MTTEYQAAMSKFAADNTISCATSADIAKAAKARAAAKAAHAAKAVKAAKVAEAEAALIVKGHTANVTKAAYPTGKPAAKGFCFHAKAIFLTHPHLFSIAGGVIVGIVVYRLADKYWLNKKQDTVKS